MSTNTKTRVGALLKEVILVRKSPHKDKDLDTLVVHYHDLQKKLKALLANLKSEHQTMIKYHEARAKVATQIAILTKETPIFEAAGSEEAGQQGGSYSSMHKDLAKKSHDRAAEFQKHVIDYVTEWDSVISTRVDAGVKKSVVLRRELDHYESKVDHLKLKKIPDEEKVDRNADKQAHARDDYENHVADMRTFLEEVTDRSWKDLIPLLARMAAWDKKTAEDEAMCLGKMNEVVEKLSAVALTYNMEGGSFKCDEPRFQQLAHDDSTSLLSPQTQPKFETPVKGEPPEGEPSEGEPPEGEPLKGEPLQEEPLQEEPEDDAKSSSVSSDGNKDETASPE
jgi:hypothetical protein